MSGFAETLQYQRSDCD